MGLKKKVKEVEPILFELCAFGEMKCGNKLTSENRCSYKGWAVCEECYELHQAKDTQANT